ncbi:uncharacterized protein BXZ73DRAFT_107583 [Epithele typhae]|uniref:uncharacterized protein n=1 Tax=Epithele typhae TaxID=378194 RepID=UPI002008503B|nr:uncharacterized protein BXZ73DRAFT_107583 [Epithele typhae]KAH9912139.1 hypothetical protein BXZ73DRAFT_107583 [Epithele typhae]
MPCTCPRTHSTLKRYGGGLLVLAAVPTIAVAGAALALPAIGFASTGVVGGSIAAGLQSVVYGGATGGMFAALQSAGATVVAPAAAHVVAAASSAGLGFGILASDGSGAAEKGNGSRGAADGEDEMCACDGGFLGIILLLIDPTKIGTLFYIIARWILSLLSRLPTDALLAKWRHAFRRILAAAMDYVCWDKLKDALFALSSLLLMLGILAASIYLVGFRRVGVAVGSIAAFIQSVFYGAATGGLFSVFQCVGTMLHPAVIVGLLVAGVDWHVELLAPHGESRADWEARHMRGQARTSFGVLEQPVRLVRRRRRRA